MGRRVGKVEPMAWLSPERYASELEAETDRLAAAAGRQSPAATVPTCPDWTVRDLVTHVGSGAAVHQSGFDSKVWTWQPAHQTPGFWLRRMLHDEIVHRFDAEPGGDLAPDVAADGIADILLVFETIVGPGGPRSRERPLAGTGAASPPRSRSPATGRSSTAGTT